MWYDNVMKKHVKLEIWFDHLLKTQYSITQDSEEQINVNKVIYHNYSDLNTILAV